MELVPEEKSGLSRLGDSLLPKAALFTAAAAIGIGWLLVVLQLQNAGYKAWVLVLAVLALGIIIAVTRRPKELLLFGWVFSLTYNRQYFVFEPLVGYNGTAGPYVILADACLIGLLGWWLFEHLFRRTKEGPTPAPAWPWYLPFAAVCFLSVFAAVRVDWSLYEFVRILKMGLVLFYVRHNVRGREWRIVLAALACAVCFQSAVAIKEITTGRLGVIGLSKVAGAPDLVEENFAGGKFTGVRGMGTLAHPPYLACYLLLVLPLLLALTYGVKERGRAVAFGFAFLLGCGGLVATLSRWPWIVAALQTALLLAGLVWLRLVSFRRAAGFLVLGVTVTAAGLLPFNDKIIARFTGDFTESVQWREQGTQASLAAIADHPLLGFGLNNTSLYIHAYMPEMEWGLESDEFASRTLHLRAPVALANGFLYVVEQTGILGAIGFLILVAGGISAGIRALAQTADECRAICLGLMIGILGALIEQLVDAPLWVDTNLYTFTLYLGLLNNAPVIFGAGNRGAEAFNSREELSTSAHPVTA
jgi:O-antigen ligase